MIVALGAILSCSALHQARAHVVQLPEYPKTPQPHPYAISADGRTVVGQFAPGNAFIWRGSETIKFKPNPDPSVLAVYAQALSGDGSVVVGKAGVAYVYSRLTGLQLLGKLPGDIDSFAYDVSRDGTTVVGYSQAPTYTRAFVWQRETGMTEIPAPQTLSSTMALGISLDGKHAVGISTVDGTVRAFSTDFKVSELLPIGRIFTDSSANDISENGEVIVGSVSGENGSRACFWKRGMLHVLPNLGKTNANAKCVSPDGKVLGGFIGDDAIIWRAEVPTRLSSLLESPGWTFESVNGITHLGEKLALTGWGRRGGKSVGYYAVLSE